MGNSNSVHISLFNYISKFPSDMRSSFRRLAIRILKIGPIPEHVAIIMDGNRRFADRFGMERHKGHIYGYYQLIKTLENCWELGVKYVTVYAFSIDNFARPPEEVNTLMNLLMDKLNELMTKDQLLNNYGVRVQLLGKLDLLPERVQAAAQRAMAATRDNRSVVLNLCVAYTSTEEIVQSIERTRDNVLMTCREGISGGKSQLTSELRETLCTGDWTRNDVTHLSSSESKIGGTRSRESYICDQQSGHDRPSSLEIQRKHDADAITRQMLKTHGDERNRLYDDVRECDPRNSSLPNGAEEPKVMEEVDGRRASVHSRDGSGAADVSVIEANNRRRGNDGSTDIDSRAELPVLLDSVTSETLESHLYTAGCPTPDILLRTSGETRLSNFMLWQCSSDSRLVFCKVLWPEFKLRHFSLIVLEYQRALSAMQRHKNGQNQTLHGTD